MEEQVQINPFLQILRQCPVCRSASLREVIALRDTPILSNVLWDSRADALTAPRGDVELAFCETCGHVFNQAFDSGKMVYNLRYENSLHFSARFQSYASELAHYLVDRFDLHGKKLVEIGSGKGDFLGMLCDQGGNTGFGFDPSYEPVAGEGHPSISYIRDIYTDKYTDHQADFILSRHVLEHIEQPADFIRGLRQTIGQRLDTVVFTEVPNFGYILRDTAIWDIIYEHFSYFSHNSLAYLFSRYGFNILNVAEAYEGQFLYIESSPRPTDQPPAEIFAAYSITDLAQQVNSFRQRSQDKMARWQQQIDQLHASGKRALLWGAGSKGISFLNLLHVNDQVQYIVDINPRKRNKYITGTGQQIVPPEFLKDYRPDVVIIMNPIYRQEIQDTISALDLKVEYMLAG